MRTPKYHIYLTNEERSEVLKSLIDLKNSFVACGSSTKQDVVTGVQSDTETKTAYFAVKTSAGSLKIVKTSDDGKIEGIKFKVTGADNYSKTVTTNAEGEFQIDDLKVGTYTVTEVTEERYEDQKAQTVKVESGKTATVKFSNILKRGELQVVKTSEDNFNEGVKFHLYGTSLSGAKVDEYATTDKNGVIIAIVLLVFIIGGFIFLQIKNRNNKK